MKLSEFRRYLKSLGQDEKDELILELYKRQSKLDKEMIELIMTGIHEHKELPAAKAIIPDLKNGRKKFEQHRDRVFLYGTWKRRPRAKFKADFRQMIKDLCAIPARASGYEEACALLKDIFFLLCAGECGLYVWGDPFADVGTSRKDLYRKLCTLYLDGGYKVKVLEELLDFQIECACDSWFDQTEMAEVLLSFIKNGDLRSEMIWMIEDKIAKLRASLKTAEHAGRAEMQLQRLAVVYLVFASREESEEQALASLKDLFDEPTALQIAGDWKRAKQAYEELETETETEEC